MKHIRDQAAKLEFHEAGTGDQDKMATGILASEIDHLYIRWGLKQVLGLSIDGSPATPDTLVACGPEELFDEALQAVKHECGLSEQERKN